MDDILKRLEAKKQRLDIYKPLPKELVKNLEEWFRIELTYTSNAIEGNTLTRQETALIVEEGITVQGKSIVEHQEAINHAEAFDFIQTLTNEKKRKVTEKDIRDLHSLILNKIDDTNKGRYRTVAVRLRGTETILPNALKIPDLMTEFMTWLQNKNVDHPVKIAIDAHYKLVSIHPFVDGNGRTARLLMNLLLMQEGYPPAIIRKEDRNGYITSLEKGQTKGHLTDYYALMYEAVDRSLDIYLEAVEPDRASIKEPTSEQRFYTTEEVAQLIKVDPESVRRYVRSGKLRAVKLGGKFIRIDRKDLNSFIEELKT
ncbi:MAG: Fic family protein [Candidatus Levybacteria bacterium]|nr:Fic family protein [Candidatus Levybacteria bacterium]